MVSRDLREKILTGKLVPGCRISQLAIAEQYGVSRLPAREALAELAGEGLVVIEKARTARVAALDDDDLREVYLMREQLEPLAMALAVPTVTESDITEAEALLGTMERCHTDSDEWLRLDRQFHTMWYERTGMPRLIGTIDQLWDIAQRYRALFSMTPDAASRSDYEHRLMLEAIRRDAPEQASAMLQVHLRHVRLTLQTPAGHGHDSGPRTAHAPE
jgi:DNA-binding GntR family transcriptional regulator